MNNGCTSTGRDHACLNRQGRLAHGKDHLNFADWRIGLTKYEVPRKADGGKLDYIETVIQRSGAPDQKLTKMSPAAVGLPTPIDDDVFIAILTLAKQQDFNSDVVRFVPRQLLQILRWDHSSESYDRLDQSLTRLCAVTLRFEYVWYDKRTAEVEPILTTGILAEAKLVRRRGSKARHAGADSYIQWTKYLYEHIQAGNLTTINLDLYFSLRRPGARFLYRHLNKRRYNHRRQKPYERDLKDLACGHLGMKYSKDLKRNFYAIVDELETSGYLASGSTHFIKIRPGQYRVRFDSAEPSANRDAVSAANEAEPPQTDEEGTIVSAFHRQRPKQAVSYITQAERRYARELINQHGFTLVQKLLPKLARRIEAEFPTCKTFCGTRRYFDQIIQEYHARQRRDEQCHKEDLAQRVQNEISQRNKEDRLARRSALLSAWNELADEEKHALYCATVEAQASQFLRDRIRRRTDLTDPPIEVLDFFARQRGLPTIFNT